MVVRDVNFDLRTELKNILMRHEGPQRAITAGELARMLGYKNDRIIRLAIRQLIKGDGDGNRGMPIASSTENSPGYFIITSRQQADEYALSIRRRLIEDALRRRDFRRAADQWLVPAEQGRLI